MKALGHVLNVVGYVYLYTVGFGLLIYAGYDSFTKSNGFLQGCWDFIVWFNPWDRGHFLLALALIIPGAIVFFAGKRILHGPDWDKT